MVADASVLVAELMRDRWWTIARDSRLRLLAADAQWNETDYEITRRLAYLLEQGRIPETQHDLIQQNILHMLEQRLLEVVPEDLYRALEEVARRRIPRDPNDWPTVAVAIALDADILTNDHDFLGCGCATWTFETLRDELMHADPSMTEESARWP